jgi:hypothetical protein
MGKYTIPSIIGVISVSLIITSYFNVFAAPQAINDSTVYDARISGPENAAIGSFASFIVGDVNGDEVDDLIIGDSTENAYTGAVYIYLGGNGIAGNKLLASSNEYDIKLTGAATGYSLGYEMTTGDADGDGHDDLFLYSINPSEGNSGLWTAISSTQIQAFVDSPTTEFSLASDQNFYLQIRSTSDIGQIGPISGFDLARGTTIVFSDISRDGIADILIPAPEVDTTTGAIFVLTSEHLATLNDTGNIISLDTPTDYSLKISGEVSIAPNFSALGIECADLNGDTFPELLTANFNDSSIGYAYVIDNAQLSGYGTTTGNTLDLTEPTNYIVRYRGLSTVMVRLADVSGDNKADAVLSVPFSTTNSYVAVIFSERFETLAETTTRGLQADIDDPLQYNLLIGTTNNETLPVGSFIQIGDLNQDGLNDLDIMAGTSTEPNHYLFFSTLIENYSSMGHSINIQSSSSYNVLIDTENDAENNGESQFSFTKIVDLTGDGHTDLVLSNQASSNGVLTNAGQVWVHDSALFAALGTTTGNTFDPALESNRHISYAGPAEGTFLSEQYSIATGDFNNDSFADLVLGASKFSTNGTNSGTIWVVQQRTTDNTAPTLTIDQPPTSVTTPAAITFSGTTRDQQNKLSSIMYRVGADATWQDCSINDGLLDEFTENFSCSIASSLLTVGQTYAISIRSTDSENNSFAETYPVTIEGSVVPTSTPTATPLITTILTPTAIATVSATPSHACGDGIINGAETCDGLASITHRSCMDYDKMYTSGELTCSNMCQIDASACSFVQPTITDTPTPIVTTSPSVSVTNAPIPTQQLSVQQLLQQYGLYIAIFLAFLVLLMIYLWIRNTKV